MARRRRRRSYGAMVRVPGLGFLGQQVNSTDVALGAGLGLLGTLVLKGAGNKYLTFLPDAVRKGSPLIGGALTGAAAWYWQKSTAPSRANAYLAGAVLAGASIQAWDILKTQFPGGLGDVVSLRFNGNRYGVFIDERTPSVGPGGASMGGLLIDEPGRSMSDYNLGQLAQMSMGDDDELDGIEELMAA